MKQKLKQKGYKLKNIWLKEYYVNDDFSFSYISFKMMFGDLYRKNRNGKKNV